MSDENRFSGEPASQEPKASVGGTQQGGGPSSAEMAAGGGSSGSGGYGNAQNQQFHQGQQESREQAIPPEGRSRGEQFDEAQGGGRGGDNDDVATDQAQHQDRGQSAVEDEEAG